MLQKARALLRSWENLTKGRPPKEREQSRSSPNLPLLRDTWQPRFSMSHCANQSCLREFVEQTRGGRLGTFIDRGNGRVFVPRRHVPDSNEYVCNGTCEGEILWIANLNGWIVVFKRVNVAGNGDCLFASISSQGFPISRDDLVSWLESELLSQVSSNSVDLRPSMVCLADEMLSLVTLYRTEPNTLHAHDEQGRVDASWYKRLVTRENTMNGPSGVPQNTVENLMTSISSLVRPV